MQIRQTRVAKKATPKKVASSGPDLTDSRSLREKGLEAALEQSRERAKQLMDQVVELTAKIEAMRAKIKRLKKKLA